MGDLSTIINYALKKAVMDLDAEMIRSCINHGAVVNTDMLIWHLRMIETPFGRSDYRGQYNADCPVFEILINNISSTVVIPDDLLLLYVNYRNPYYLETILTTKRYEPSSKALLSALETLTSPQYTIDLLLEHGFGNFGLDSIIMKIIYKFNQVGLSRLIAARVNLVPHQCAIFAFLSDLHKQNPTFTGIILHIGDNIYIRNMFEHLINYLTSNPHSAMHYMIVQYLQDNALLGMFDVAKYIWQHYLNITVGVHSDYINFYQSVRDSIT